MKIYKISEKSKATEEMIAHYKSRTKKHIDLVKKYCDKILDYDKEQFSELEERKTVHDDSKFENPELDPYVFITWKYKCKDEGIDFEVPQEMEEKMLDATIHHITINSHHPEYHLPKEKKEGEEKYKLINENNRDRPPEEIVDATSMPEIDIAEMVADWCAVSEERNNSPKDWADKNTGTRWKFSEKQKDLIYKLIKNIWE